MQEISIHVLKWLCLPARLAEKNGLFQPEKFLCCLNEQTWTTPASPALTSKKTQGENRTLQDFI